MLVVAVGSNYNPVTALNDSQGNTYTEIDSDSQYGSPSTAFASIWYTIPKSTSSDTINVYTGSGGDADVFIYEIANAQKSFVSSSGGGAYTVSPSVGQFTPFIGFVVAIVGDNVGCSNYLGAGTNYTYYAGTYRGVSEVQPALAQGLDHGTIFWLVGMQFKRIRLDGSRDVNSFSVGGNFSDRSRA